MKTIAPLLLAIALLCGCATTPQTDTQKVARVATISRQAAFVGTKVYLQENPDARPYFVASAAALDVLLQSQNVTPEDFSKAMQGLPVKELQSDSGALIVGSAVVLYDAFLAEHVNLDANAYLRPVIAAVHDGIAKGLE